MRLPENIESFIKNRKPHVAASADIDKRVLDDSFAAMEEAMQAKPVVNQPNIFRTIMKMKITKFAAAVIFIAVIIGLHQFRISIIGTRVVWADVAERLEKVSSYKARSHRVFTEAGQEKPVFDCNVFKYFSPELGGMERQYIDGELGMLLYALFPEKSLIIVLPQTKQYYRFELNEEIISMIEYMVPTNTDGMMKLFGSERCIKLGSREIDGVTVEGFEVKDIKVFSLLPRFLFQLENIDVRLWVNTETLLPVEIEAEGFLGKGLLTGFKDLIGKEVVYDIEYDAEIDESIFEPNIPDDYMLIDPANIAEKAELVMLGILPFSAVIITYKHFKKKRCNVFNIADSPPD